MTLHPAPVNTGYVFRVNKNQKTHSIKASYKNVKATKLCTTLGFNGNTISTVEHILSALFGLDIDTLQILIIKRFLFMMDHQRNLSKRLKKLELLINILLKSMLKSKAG